MSDVDALIANFFKQMQVNNENQRQLLSSPMSSADINQPSLLLNNDPTCTSKDAPLKEAINCVNDIHVSEEGR